jgi:hypothetical protein
MKADPGKPFVIHLDFNVQGEKNSVRISLSNLFKEYKVGLFLNSRQPKHLLFNNQSILMKDGVLLQLTFLWYSEQQTTSLK